MFAGFTHSLGRTPSERHLNHPKDNFRTCSLPLKDYRDNLKVTLRTFVEKPCNMRYRYYASEATKAQRNPLFSTTNSDDISYFKEVLGEKNVIQDEDRLLAANMDWMQKYKGSSKVLLQPKSTEEVHIFLSKNRCLLLSTFFLRLSDLKVCGSRN